MHSAIRTLLPLSALLVFAGCPRPARPPEPTPPVTPAPTAPADLSGAAVYTVNPQTSEVHILVYRGGTLSKLGHNHVMTSRTLSGRVWVHPTFERSGFEVSFPVRELIVDDREARRAAGGDFPPDIPQKDKDGTRTNMLREEVLDGERYPTVSLRAARVAGSTEAPDVSARITIKDASREVAVPARIVTEGGRLTASGEFVIRQSDFGMKPFSIALGALEVKDELTIRYKIVADRKN